MKTTYFLFIATVTTVASQLTFPGLFKTDSEKPHRGGLSTHELDYQVVVMANNPNMPPSAQDNPDVASSMLHSPIISDVLGKSRVINIFSGFTRDIEAIANRLSSISTRTTLLAPVNSAIAGLPRKPWEDPDGATVYAGDDGKDKAQENLKKFVESHAVPLSPWAEGEKVKTLAGQEVWWVSDGDKKIIKPGDIEVVSVAEKVLNGEVWILKGVRNYA